MPSLPFGPLACRHVASGRSRKLAGGTGPPGSRPQRGSVSPNFHFTSQGLDGKYLRHRGPQSLREPSARPPPYLTPSAGRVHKDGGGCVASKLCLQKQGVWDLARGLASDLCPQPLSPHVCLPEGRCCLRTHGLRDRCGAGRPSWPGTRGTQRLPGPGCVLGVFQAEPSPGGAGQATPLEGGASKRSLVDPGYSICRS